MSFNKATASIALLTTAAVLSAPNLAIGDTIATDQGTISGEGTREGRADAIPWSGIWWAFSDLQLATGWNNTGDDFEHITGTGWQRKNASKDINDVSPMLKYDAFVKARTGTDPQSALMECTGDDGHDFHHSIYGAKKEQYDRDGISYSWWGHCNGWCAAALMEKEPISPVTAEGIRFDVADLKGLLSETYWGVESDFTGRRYNKPRALYSDNRQAGKDLLEAIENGNPKPVAEYIEWYEKVYETTMSASARTNAKADDFKDELEGFEDWFVNRYDRAFDDLDPDVLHQILETVIGTKKLALVFDVTANEEVWNHPAFAYESQITHKRDFTDNNKSRKEWDVRTTVWYATDGVSHSILGISAFTKVYTYTLVTDENDKIISGQYTGNSRQAHPDFAWLPTNNPNGSDDGENPNIKYSEIKRILPKVHRANEERPFNISVDGSSAASRRDHDKTTTWTRPVATSREVTLTANIGAGQNITRIEYFEQKVSNSTATAIVRRVPLVTLGESTTGPDFNVNAQFPSNGKKMIVARAYDPNGVLIGYDEITVQVSSSNTGNTSPQSDDNFEHNDSKANAASISAGSYPNLVCNDSDWYKVTLPTNGDLSVKISFTHSSGDLDMTLHNSSQLGKSDSTNNAEEIDKSNLNPGTYYIRVYGYNNAKNDYAMTINVSTTPTTSPRDDAFEPNNSSAAAALVAPGLHSNLECKDDDWYQIVVTEESNIKVHVNFTNATGDLDMVLTDSSGAQLDKSESTADSETVRKNAVAPGSYRVRVFGYSGAKAPYSMIVTVEATGNGASNGNNSNNGDDAFEDNDSQGSAAVITVGIHPNLVCKDKDWYKITVPSNSTLTFKISFQNAAGDLDMVLTNAAGTVLERSETTTDIEAVRKSNLSAGTYYVRIYGYQGAQAPYDLTVSES
jgi:hypothetical protein